MDQIINFRASIDTFDEYEFELFCNKLYKEYNKRELIIKSLFYLLIEDSKHNKYNNVSKINKITKNIIDLRKKKLSSQSLNNNTNDHIIKMTINDLASPLIAHTASYLTLSQQTSLITCNRYIFSSLTSSLSRIQKLNKVNWFKHYKINHGPRYCPYQMKKLSRFRMVKEINIDPRESISEFYKSFPWNKLNLDVLSLNNLVTMPGVPVTDTVERLMENTINILKKIRLKQLSVRGWVVEELKNNFFVNLMKANVNIECLSLGRVHCLDNDLIQTAMSKVMIKLKGLIIKQRRSSTIPLILHTGEQLVSLHLNFGQRARQPTLPSNKTFNNLQELCLNECVVDNILFHIIKSAKNLRLFCWKISDNINYNDIKYILSTIISEREDFKYLNIHSSSVDSFKILHNILNTNKYKRNNLKIRLYFDMYVDIEELEYLKNNILKFVNALNESVRNGFMLILGIYLRDNKQFDEIDGVLHVMGNVYLIRTCTRKRIKKNENNEILRVYKQIIICNKQNKMCGYRERWSYSCVHCNKQW